MHRLYIILKNIAEIAKFAERGSNDRRYGATFPSLSGAYSASQSIICFCVCFAWALHVC